MANRTLWRGLGVTLAAFLVALGLMLFALNRIQETGIQEQAASLRAAVLRAAVTCYAVEGRYPPNAQYLCDYYGLVYNPARFVVKLDAFADNLLPDIAVLVKGESTDE